MPHLGIVYEARIKPIPKPVTVDVKGLSTLGLGFDLFALFEGPASPEDALTATERPA